jgi:hypothetical protein
VSDASAGELIDVDVYCPQCLYNVRGVEGGRCPECGILIDREQWAASPIPWEHRSKLGRVRGYVRTVRLVTSRARRLAMATPQGLSVRDAWFFWMLTALPPAGLLMFWILRMGGQSSITEPVVGYFTYGAKVPTAWMDLFGPWEAGMLWPGILPLAVLAVMLWITLGMALMCRWSASVDDKDRVWAMALYASAPLAYWTITLLCGWGLLTVASHIYAMHEQYPLLGVLVILLMLVPLPWWVWRMAWTALVVGKCSFPKAAMIAVGGLAMLVGCGFVMPWVIGLVRMMVVG